MESTSFFYAHSHCVWFREDAFAALATIGHVHYAGKCTGSATSKYGRNNNSSSSSDNQIFNRTKREETSGGTKLPKWETNNILLRDYRFALVMENTNRPGYITEKILNAFLAGSVPIWYGTSEVINLFNEKAFIYYDIYNPQEAIDRVRYLERNQTAYREVLQQPILANGKFTIDEYFSIQTKFESGRLYRRIRAMVQVPVATLANGTTQ